jgi:hypothetical protein
MRSKLDWAALALRLFGVGVRLLAPTLIFGLPARGSVAWLLVSIFCGGRDVVHASYAECDQFLRWAHQIAFAVIAGAI